jgi:hypothetical protein
MIGAMSTKSRESIYGTTIRMSAERAKEARKEADRLACEAWNYRMLGYKGPAQPSPTLGDALNAVICTSKCDASVATPIRLSRSTWCGDRRRHRYTSLSGTCDARTVRRCGVMRTREATWWPCGPEGFPRVTRHRLGGRGKDEATK